MNIRTLSEYSILIGLGKLEDYIVKAKSLGDDTVFLTDNNLHGTYEFFELCKKHNVKGVLGLELNVKHKNNDNYKIVLYTKNYEGYKALTELETLSTINKDNTGEKFVHFNDIKENENIISMIPYESGFLTDFLVNKNSLYKDYLLDYKKTFSNNLFIEEQPHKLHLEKKIGRKIKKSEYLEMHKYINLVEKSMGIKILPSNYTLYTEKEQSAVYDVFNGIRTGLGITSLERETYELENHAYLSQDEIKNIFGDKVKNIEEFKNNFTQWNIPKINYLPHVGLDKDTFEDYNAFVSQYGEMDDQEFKIRYDSFKGHFKRIEKKLSKESLFLFISKEKEKVLDLKSKKYTEKEIKEISLINSEERKNLISKLSEKDRQYIEQLDYELLVIDGMGFNRYFLLVSDYISWAKNNDIPVGPGRGSAAGSIMAYNMGITDVDPIEHGLLFERFLNPARVSMPDIDTDFEPELRSKVIQYVRDKYNVNNVAEVTTYGKLQSKNTIKDVGKYYGENFNYMNRFVGNLPGKGSLSDFFKTSDFLKNEYNTNPKIRKIMDVSKVLEGNNRHTSVHACAVIISPENLKDYTALIHDKGKIISQFDAHVLEDLGFLKMDFLGLRNLSIINNSLIEVQGGNYKNKNISKLNEFGKIDLLKIDYNDKEVLKEVFGNGDTTGVFQFESLGMRANLKKLKPDTFNDIVAMVALYRPGPMAFIPSYVKRKHGEEPITYLNNVLEPIMKDTYGISIFQEQIIKMVQVYAGYSTGEADILRRAIGKKKKDIIEEQKSVFIGKAVERGHDKYEATKIFEEVIEPAGDYSFNKSHAVCYAMIAFQTAYIKKYFPTPFYWSLLNSYLEIGEEEGDTNKKDIDKIGVVYNELKEKGMTLLAPDINISSKKFEILEDNIINFALYSIKGCPVKIVDAIIEERETGGEFKSISDFLLRSEGKFNISKSNLETLIGAGCFDKFGDRLALLKEIDNLLDISKKEYKPEIINLENIKYLKNGLKSLSGDNKKKFNNIVNDILQTGQLFHTREEFIERYGADMFDKKIFEYFVKTNIFEIDMFRVHGTKDELVQKVVDIWNGSSNLNKDNFKKEKEMRLQEIENNIVESDEKSHIIDKILVEKKLMGYYIQGNPFIPYKDYFKKYDLCQNDIMKIGEYNSKVKLSDEKKEINVVGFVDDKFHYTDRYGKRVTIIRVNSIDFNFTVKIDHPLIQEEQILVGNVLKIKDKSIMFNEDGEMTIKNPFNFKTTTFKGFENNINGMNSSIKTKTKLM